MPFLGFHKDAITFVFLMHEIYLSCRIAFKVFFYDIVKNDNVKVHILACMYPLGLVVAHKKMLSHLHNHTSNENFAPCFQKCPSQE
uniref:Uncharacterized protein n=1 Tax=Rhizophora mucronata TaxID=61149 RepID=A0A2P2MMS0_RHIMU